MEYPPEIIFNNLRPSEFVERSVLHKIEKLTQTFAGIIHCRVVISASDRRKRQGQLYKIGLHIKVPNGEIVVSNHTGGNGQYEDVYVALRDAFLAANRKLKRYRGKMSRHVKRHQSIPRGKITKIFPEQGFGFLLTNDQREVFFDMNSIVDTDFNDLQVGQKVKVVIAQGEEGPQASTLYGCVPGHKREADRHSGAQH